MKNDLYAHHCFELRRRNILLEALTGRHDTRMDAACRRSADMTSMLNDRKRNNFDAEREGREKVERRMARPYFSTPTGRFVRYR